MIKVRLISGWGCDLSQILFAHSPGNNSSWREVIFTEDPIDDSDYIIVLNSPPRDMEVSVRPERLWCCVGEPDIGFYRYLHRNRKEYARVYGCDEKASLEFGNYVLSMPIMDRWKINRSYDFLKNPSNVPSKDRNLSWITSNKARGKGHKQRLQFLDRLVKSGLEFDLFGRGFNFVKDKWNAIAPYRYSIAYENHRSNLYWTEKLADVLLCETMPIYFGCKKITNYFPKDSMVTIDPEDKYAVHKIREIIGSDLREQNIESIREAKNLVLDKYNMLPLLATEVLRYSATASTSPRKKIMLKKVRAVLPHWVFDQNFLQWPYYAIKSIVSKSLGKLKTGAK